MHLTRMLYIYILLHLLAPITEKENMFFMLENQNFSKFSFHVGTTFIFPFSQIIQKYIFHIKKKQKPFSIYYIFKHTYLYMYIHIRIYIEYFVYLTDRKYT